MKHAFLFTLSSLVVSGAAVNLFSIASVPTLNPTLSPTAVVAAPSFAASTPEPALLLVETDLAPSATLDAVLRRRLQRQNQGQHQEDDGGGGAAVGYMILMLWYVPRQMPTARSAEVRCSTILLTSPARSTALLLTAAACRSSCGCAAASLNHLLCSCCTSSE